jgi:hypothetical protein
MTAKVIVCLDGCGPDYLAGSETPNLDAIAREGFHTIGEAVDAQGDVFRRTPPS